MKIIRWSVNQPAAVLTFHAALIALAVLALMRFIPTRMMAYVESPTVAVVTSVNGMPAEDVEASVTNPIERRLANQGGVRFIRSTSMNGISIVTLEYPYRTDLQRALQDVQSQISSLDLHLDPRNSTPPRVLRIDPLNLPVLRLALVSQRWDPASLRHFADTEVASRLKALPGVANVYVRGGPVDRTEVIVDRDRLTRYGISITDVRDALDAAYARRGAMGPPIVRVVDAPLSPRALEEVVVGRVGGRTVRLRDVADVSVEPGQGGRTSGHATHHAGLAAAAHHASHSIGTSIYRLNGHEAIEVNVVADAAASSPRIVSEVRAELDRLADEYPAVSFSEAYDNAHFVNVMAHGVAIELGVAILLTGLVTWIFLGDLRGTLVALVTIPSSLACALVFFVPLGLSLNSSSLIGLLLAIGRLVDDTIVDLHSVYRHLANGEDSRTAAINGCSEVRRAVISSTIIICLAMLPLTFSGGLTQDMFCGIVWPFLLSLAGSLMVALTLTPVLASRWLRRPPTPRAWVTALESRYRGVLAWSLRHRGRVICGAVAVVYVGAMLIPLVGSEMMPLSDTGQAYAVLEAQPGTALSDTERMAEQLETLLLKRPEVKSVSTEVGWEDSAADFTGYGVGDQNTATMMITLSDMDARRTTIWDVMDHVWADAMRKIVGIRRLSIKEMGSDVMASAMAPIEILVHGPDFERLDWLTRRTAEMAARNPNLYQVGTMWGLDAPQWAVHVDPRRASDLGLTPAGVADQLSYALDGGQTLLNFGGTYPLLLRYASDQREDVGAVTVVGDHGPPVPLRALARLERTQGASMIVHDGGRRVNSVTAYYRRGGPGSMQLTMDLMMNAAMNLPFPPGYGLEQRGDMTQMMDSFDRLLGGLVIALVLIYLALVVQFGSALTPLSIMAAIPLELCGVVLALLLAQQTFSTVSLLGLVVLNGMDVTASILLIDRIVGVMRPTRGEERSDRPLHDAILEAGPVRLVPILMTVLVTMIVIAPVAFFPRPGVDAYSPLATVILGGLAMSTPLTLIVVPVLYTVFSSERDGRR